MDKEKIICIDSGQLGFRLTDYKYHYRYFSEIRVLLYGAPARVDVRLSTSEEAKRVCEELSKAIREAGGESSVYNPTKKSGTAEPQTAVKN